MPLDRCGVTTVEALLGLLLFTVGLAGASVTAVSSLRALRGSRYESRLGWLLQEVAVTLRGPARWTSGECAALHAGSRDGPDGARLIWSFAAGPGGAEALITVSPPPATRRAPDSVRVFVACR